MEALIPFSMISIRIQVSMFTSQLSRSELQSIGKEKDDAAYSHRESIKPSREAPVETSSQ